MRDIPGYEGLYAATSCGKIWSYRRKRFLKPQKDKDGYYKLNLYKDGKPKRYFVHRLIASTYLENPLNLPQINHIDENKANNALPNLEWCDAAYNNNYGTRKEKVRKKVICVETGIIYNSLTDAAKAVDISLGNISSCLTGRYKTAAGLHWAYYD